MKKTWLLVPLIMAFASTSAFPQALDKRDEFGLGIVLGEPSGVNAQVYWTPHSTVGITAAWSVHDWLFVAADYQILNRLGDSPPEWRWFYGLGAYLGTPHNARGLIGGRIPLGIKYKIPSSIVDVWGELVPALRLVPDTQAEFQGGIGVTLWIK